MSPRERYTRAELRRLVPGWYALVALGTAIAGATVVVNGGTWYSVVLGGATVFAVLGVRTWRMYSDASPTHHRSASAEQNR